MSTKQLRQIVHDQKVAEDKRKKEEKLAKQQQKLAADKKKNEEKKLKRMAQQTARNISRKGLFRFRID